MSRVLLTGARGFLGAQALAPLLDEGHEVHAVSRHSGEPQPGVVWHSADLLVPGAAEALAREVGAEQLLHFAWYVEHGRFWSSVENVRWVGATLGLLRAFAESGGRRAILAGTCAEYDWSHEVLSEENTPLAPSTLYGTCKHATHLVAEGFADEAGISLAWGRIFFLYGPGEPPTRLVPSIARAVLAGQEARATSGRQIRDFMHVEDVARAFVTLLDSPAVGAVNIASGEGVAVGDLVARIAAAAGRPDLVRLGALPDQPADPPRLVADARRLHGELAFSPRFTLAQGIADAVEWWSSERAAPAGGDG